MHSWSLGIFRTFYNRLMFFRKQNHNMSTLKSHKHEVNKWDEACEDVNEREKQHQFVTWQPQKATNSGKVNDTTVLRK